MGVKDIGFGMTVSNKNSTDLVALYQLAKGLNMEFATATFHNSYYFHNMTMLLPIKMKLLVILKNSLHYN
jgi:hypothetical protein